MIDVLASRPYVMECDRESKVQTIFHLRTMNAEEFARLQGVIDLRTQAALDAGAKSGDPDVRAAAVKAQMPIIADHTTKIENWPGPDRIPMLVEEKNLVQECLSILPALGFNEITNALVRSQALTELEGKVSASQS